MIKVVKQFAIDGTFWVCLYFGMYLGVSEVRSALLFALWVVSVILWLFIVAPLNDEVKEKISKTDKPPKWLSSYGIGSTWIESMALAAFGHYVIATVYLLGSLMARGKFYNTLNEEESTK